MSALPQTEQATDEQGVTLASVVSGRLRVHRDHYLQRWMWDQGWKFDADGSRLPDPVSPVSGHEGWDLADPDVPDPVRRVVDLHDRDWITVDGKLTPLGLAVYLQWVHTTTGVPVAVDRVPVEVPVPVQVPIN